ncbi:hypothetical protein G7Y89_g1339 [Cudoniella acicularis]|uniref:Uncharacterized protein n=1 Tax=Cudoniella acicularis TaxID=354080 RepID=A0A8H4RVG4_9HELO|nr:hypothetical protein G7Y89_g1339 [Cudoniella acicularis]
MSAANKRQIPLQTPLATPLRDFRRLLATELRNEVAEASHTLKSITTTMSADWVAKATPVVAKIRMQRDQLLSKETVYSEQLEWNTAAGRFTSECIEEALVEGEQLEDQVRQKQESLVAMVNSTLQSMEDVVGENTVIAVVQKRYQLNAPTKTGQSTIPPPQTTRDLVPLPSAPSSFKHLQSHITSIASLLLDGSNRGNHSRFGHQCSNLLCRVIHRATSVRSSN